MAMTSDAPDDGFANVETKLKAFVEKMQTDAVKFEADTKASASSFLQTSNAPDDGFTKVEAKLKALEQKMKADAAKFEVEAKAPASSFVQTSGEPFKPTGGRRWIMTEAELFEKKHPITLHPHNFSHLEKRMEALRKAGDNNAQADEHEVETQSDRAKEAAAAFVEERKKERAALLEQVQNTSSSFVQIVQAKDSLAETPQERTMDHIQTEFKAIDEAEKKAKVALAEEEAAHTDFAKSHVPSAADPTSFAQMPLDDAENALEFKEKLGDVRSELKDEDALMAGDGSSFVDVPMNDPGALTLSVPASAVDPEKGLDLDSPDFQALLMGSSQAGTVADGSTNLRKA